LTVRSGKRARCTASDGKEITTLWRRDLLLGKKGLPLRRERKEKIVERKKLRVFFILKMEGFSHANVLCGDVVREHQEKKLINTD